MANRRKRPSSRVTVFTRDESVDDPTTVLTTKLFAASSRAVLDPFTDQYHTNLSGSAGVIVEPTLPLERLLKLPNENSCLRQCIDAYVVNIEGSGTRIEYIGPEGEEESAAAKAEKLWLENLVDNPNGEYSTTELRQRLRRDREIVGFACIEVLRDQNGDPTAYLHTPAHTIRMTQRHNDLVPVPYWIFRDGSWVRKIGYRRFRKFVQIVGTKRVYFKEFGDPRTLNSESGEFTNDTPDEKRATEIFMQNDYQPGDPYGLPRWVSQLPTILGMRESELNNLQFFKDNAIPAMAVLVAGGSLSSNSLEQLEETFTQTRGREAMNRVIVIEAFGDAEAADEAGKIVAPKLEIKSLVDERQKDALFGEYEAAGIKKIRSAFRLPPIFVGATEDMTYATAQASLTMAEAQIFSPERNRQDDEWNLRLYTRGGKPAEFWRVRSQAPRVVNPADVVAALEQFEKSGAMTPNQAIGMANELFDLTMPIIEEQWGNLPFTVITAFVKAGRVDLTPDGKLIVVAAPVEPVTEPKEGDGEGEEGEEGDDDDAKKRAAIREAIRLRRNRAQVQE